MAWYRNGGNNMELRRRLADNIYLYKIYYFLRYTLPYYVLGKKWDELETKRKYKKVFGKTLNLNKPETLNEKIQWLKLYDHDSFYTVCADKYAAREYWSQFGEDGLIPLLFQTYDWKEVNFQNLPDLPCIIKCNTGCGCYEVVRDKRFVDYERLQMKCRKWMTGNYYYKSQEWQYKNIKPCIIIEKLLLDSKGNIPNDYKLHFMNGKLQFIYCSIDREGENYRSIYSPDWKQLDLEWVETKKHTGIMGKHIECPATFHKMIEIGEKIAQRFKYVRVDFYDLEGQLYYGEITLHHGSGYDTFEPESYDLYYGNVLKI